MITIMCMFHDGMRARVQLSSSSDLSVWFHVYQGLRQGYVSSTLFNIFGEALVDVIVQRFAADPVIIANLIFLHDAPKKGADGKLMEETVLDRVRRGLGNALRG